MDEWDGTAGANGFWNLSLLWLLHSSVLLWYGFFLYTSFKEWEKHLEYGIGGSPSPVIIINAIVYCLADVLVSVVENGGTSVFLAMRVLVPAQPGIQHDLDLRGDSISKGCVCNSVLLNPCYHYISPAFRLVVLGSSVKRHPFILALCTYFLLHKDTVAHTSRKMSCKDPVWRSQFLCLVWWQSLLQIHAATIT